ncbi:MAG: acyl-CoA thioesterase [Hyphomicrobiales bacterium]|nr:acyl-CoA thioesterase [Hyphomicrobiales bacterium]MCP4932783.1 acyl-CoA thioesterase [bacterium]
MLTNQMRIRVEWGDCDPARIVFYPRYFSWVDASGHHMLEKAGLHHDVLAEKYGVRGLVLGRVGMDFKTTAVFGDTLDIESSVSRIGGASFDITHTVARKKTIILTGQETRIWAVDDPNSAVGISATRIPDEIRQLLESSPG